ncbi:structural maintenance of chromosomes 4-like protein gluon [Halictus rubicundus]|uniref:structural maintenance of chromosomes 4-like protein gluon n=1 Tax=Halictus rubicundus TaxID=77578 RepID=UPI004036B9EE
MTGTSEADKNKDSNEMEVDEENAVIDTDDEGGLKVDDDIYIPPPIKAAHELDVNGPRLMISKIVNVNFKSYGGTKTIGPFHKCFTAIVGPNGSGKSNVIDSMLFVFGYRASKIRSKKLSVLIHNSSENQNINSCTVSVHFQQIIDKPGADYDVVPNSEFSISRTAFKDNSSHYELNRKRVQFKEIAKLLKSHGVDLDHNRFLILQGEVEQIAMMKPKGQNEHDTGMLEFLEDIIGTVRYKEPLEKLSEKVEALTEYRVEKLNRLRIVEKEKAALEEPMQEAVQYLEVENMITQIQHQLYHYKRFETMKELEQQENKANELDTDIADLVDKMKEVHDERSKQNKIIEEKNKKWDSLQLKKDEISTQFNNIRKHDESLHAELVETNKRRKANIATLKTEKAKLEELGKVPEKNMKTIQECEQLIETNVKKIEDEKSVLEKLMVGLHEKTKPLLNERAVLEKELMSLRNNVDEAQAAFNIAQSEFELYISVEATEREKLEKLQNSLKLTVDTLAEKELHLKNLQTKISSTRHNLTQAQHALEKLKHKEIEETTKLKRMRISFEEQKSAMQANRSRNRIIDSLMREKMEGRITGIFGRLGDLGAIDGKYDVAISTACGPLDNIVVDKVSTAQACISFLRQNNIGRATFIPLEKQQRLLDKCRQKIQTPENVPRLFDLIRVEDERVLPAFYYGLHDTLVANDLDQATRIAYGHRRFRVVTLKGELIELSGTMSGGGRTVLRGRMGQKVIRNEMSAVDVENLQVNLNKVHEECTKLRAEYQSLENQIHRLSVDLKDMVVEEEKLCIEVKTLQEQEPSLRQHLKIQEKKVAESVADPKRVEQLKKVMDKAGKSLEKVKDNSNSVESEVQRINRKIDEISGSRVKDQQKIIANLNKTIEKAKAEICKLQVAMKTSERNLKKVEQRIDSLENDVQTCEQRLRDVQKEKQELEIQAKQCLEELNGLNEALTERDTAMASLKEELDALQARENKMKGVKIDLDQRMKECKSGIKILKQQIPDFTRKISELKLQAIPGKEVAELKELTEDQLRELDEKTLLNNMQKVKKKLPTDIPNMQVIADYKEKDVIYLKRVADLEKVTGERDKMRDIYDTARRRRIQEFLAGFAIITNKLKEMYQMITLGGDAELELVDSLDPFSEGIAFSVRPPRKSWKNICNLSGGEKTLSSLALVFALHHYKPTPLYFMDEIDAALDFKNVSIVGNYIKERTKNAQFIIISLRSNMFELADYLVGIYKTYNCTKSVNVDLRKYYEKNGIAPPTQVTSKNLYSSQVQTFTLQSHQKEKSATQNLNNLRTPEKNQENRDNALDSLGLGLCATPQKSPLKTLRSTENDVSDAANQDTGVTPLKKKRRI